MIAVIGQRRWLINHVKNICHVLCSVNELGILCNKFYAISLKFFRTSEKDQVNYNCC